MAPRLLFSAADRSAASRGATRPGNEVRVRAETPTDPILDTETVRERIDRGIAALQLDPEDRRAREEIVDAAEAWMRLDRVESPVAEDGRDTSALALWLADLAPDGRVTHFGGSDAATAVTLAGSAAAVHSYLDHPARAMVAAVSHGALPIDFHTVAEVAPHAATPSDLVVLEARDGKTPVPIERALREVRIGGWLAVVGGNPAACPEGALEAGRFRLDANGSVRPTVDSDPRAALALFRRAELTGSARGSTRLSELIRARRSPSPEPRELQRRAGRVLSLPVPPQKLIDWVGGGTTATYENIGLMNAYQLMTYCHMRPEHAILEPGCGCGRNAQVLAPYLDPERGAYEGFDICEDAITWAQREITTRYPNVRFRLADIHNTSYNPSGTLRDREYRFPYDDDRFDIVFLPSVFTHMTREGLEHYAREIHRVLKPGGLLLSWHFLLDETSRTLVANGRSTIELHDFDEVSRVKLLRAPCAAIAYDEGYVLDLYESIGLEAQAVVHGHWCGRPAEGYADYQDRILAWKPR